jgi:hypothetical protein
LEERKGSLPSESQLQYPCKHKAERGRVDVQSCPVVGEYLSSSPNLRLRAQTAQQALFYLTSGLRRRASGLLRESKSHAVLTLYVESKVGDEFRLGSLHMVDLAGPERKAPAAADDHKPVTAKTTAALSRENSKRDARGEVKQSLICFAEVLGALAANAERRKHLQRERALAGKHHGGEESGGGGGGGVAMDTYSSGGNSNNNRSTSGHFRRIRSADAPRLPRAPSPSAGGRLRADKRVPYLDSKFTQLLKDALGGNCRTLIIETVNADARHSSATESHLDAACRARLVLNRSCLNRFEPGAVSGLQRVFPDWAALGAPPEAPSAPRARVVSDASALGAAEGVKLAFDDVDEV